MYTSMNSFAELDLTSRVDFTGGALPSGFTAALPPLTAFHMEFDNAGHLIGAVLGTRLTHASSDWSIGPDDGGDALFSIGRRLDVDVKFTRLDGRWSLSSLPTPTFSGTFDLTLNGQVLAVTMTVSHTGRMNVAVPGLVGAMTDIATSFGMDALSALGLPSDLPAVPSNLKLAELGAEFDQTTKRLKTVTLGVTLSGTTQLIHTPSIVLDDATFTVSLHFPKLPGAASRSMST